MMGDICVGLRSEQGVKEKFEGCKNSLKPMAKTLRGSPKRLSTRKSWRRAPRYVRRFFYAVLYSVWCAFVDLSSSKVIMQVQFKAMQ